MIRGLLAAVGLASLCLAQEEPLRLTLREAVQLALKQNPQVQIANLNTAEQEENSKVARSALLPQLSISAFDDVRRTNIVAQIGRQFPFFPKHVGPFNLVQGGGNYSFPVFDLTAYKRWRAAQAAVGATRAGESGVREQNVQLVVSQYLGGLRAAADLKAAQSRVDLAKALYEQAADLQKAGVGTGIDTLRANVEYQNERQRLINAGTQLKTSLYVLSRLLNLDPGRNIQLADEQSFFETRTVEERPTLEAAYAARPELKGLTAQRRSLELQKEATKAERLPRFSLQGGWNELGTRPNDVIPSYQYGFNLDVPLYTGGRIRSQIAIAGLELEKVDRQVQDLKNQIALQIKTAVAQLDAARAEVETANLGAQLAREEVTQARDRFQAGVANNIEVISAQDALSRASDNQIAALYRYNQARADLARASGRMEALYAQ